MIYIDYHEPEDIIKLLAQTLPTKVMGLNDLGFADYLWTGCKETGSPLIQIERKQAGELLGDIDGCELQLRKQITIAQQTVLIIEGFIIPSPDPKETLTCSLTHKGRLTTYRSWLKPYSYIMSWLWSLDQQGISHYETHTILGTARALKAFYDNSQRPEHSTLNRYIRPKVVPRKLNPHVTSLMGLQGVNIGQAIAEALIERYGSVWNVLIAPEHELTETETTGGRRLGQSFVDKLFDAIGRDI